MTTRRPVSAKDPLSKLERPFGGEDEAAGNRRNHVVKLFKKWVLAHRSHFGTYCRYCVIGGLLKKPPLKVGDIS